MTTTVMTMYIVVVESVLSWEVEGTSVTAGAAGVLAAAGAVGAFVGTEDVVGIGEASLITGVASGVAEGMGDGDTGEADAAVFIVRASPKQRRFQSLAPT